MHTRIICIDPEEGRVEEPVKVLRAAGYEVMMALSPQVGLALTRLFPPDVVLLHSDLADLGQAIEQAAPKARIVLTGDQAPEEELRWVSSGISACGWAEHRPMH